MDEITIEGIIIGKVSTKMEMDELKIFMLGRGIIVYNTRGTTVCDGVFLIPWQDTYSFILLLKNV